MKWIIVFFTLITSSVCFGGEISNEIISMRTEFSKTFQNYDGSLTTNISMVPINELDDNGKWIDIRSIKDKQITRKAAFDDDINVYFPFVDVWKGTYPDAGFSDPGGVDYDHNIVGMANDEEGDGFVPYRQFFLWDEFESALSGIGNIDISAMSYNFNNGNSTQDSLQVTKTLSKPEINDPPTATHARNLWYNATLEPFTSVYVNSGGSPTKYTVYLTNDISTLENRINNDPYDEDNYWYSVHHRKKSESGTDGWDICAAEIDEETLGVLSITYTREGGKKAVAKLPVIVSPNPFNPITTLSFNLHEPSNVVLEIYSITGQRIVTLMDGYRGAGENTAIFDGNNYGSGIYFYRLKTQQFLSTGKMLLVK